MRPRLVKTRFGAPVWDRVAEVQGSITPARGAKQDLSVRNMWEEPLVRASFKTVKRQVPCLVKKEGKKEKKQKKERTGTEEAESFVPQRGYHHRD